MRRTKAHCALQKKGGGVIVAGMVARSWLQYPASWKRCARRLPIRQIQAVPGNFLLSARRNSASARPSHDLLCRFTSSFSSCSLSLTACRYFTVAFAPESHSYLITSRYDMHPRSLETLAFSHLAPHMSLTLDWRSICKDNVEKVILREKSLKK